MNTLGNVALFLPLGVLLPLVSNRFRLLKRVLVVALCMSLSIEAIQFVLRFLGNPRAVDIDDVILNTLGGCLGFAVYKLLIARDIDNKSA
jgi:glycopeptide antibiotics resistance protein